MAAEGNRAQEESFEDYAAAAGSTDDRPAGGTAKGEAAPCRHTEQTPSKAPAGGVRTGCSRKRPMLAAPSLGP